jgi:hypothetical protein
MAVKQLPGQVFGFQERKKRRKRKIALLPLEKALL